MNAGLVGGIIGSIVGLAGGLIGSYCSFKSAKGPRERRFVIWASIALFAFIGLFAALLFLFPRHRTWIFISYFIILVVAINCLNRRGSTLRRAEQSNA
jgi:L-asparagine transporter-like permease